MLRHLAVATRRGPGRPPGQMPPDNDVRGRRVHRRHAVLRILPVCEAANSIDDVARRRKSVIHIIEQHTHHPRVSRQIVRPAVLGDGGVRGVVAVHTDPVDISPRRRSQVELCRVQLGPDAVLPARHRSASVFAVPLEK